MHTNTEVNPEQTTRVSNASLATVVMC